MHPLLLVLHLPMHAPAPVRSEPVRIVREIQAEVDRNGGASLERRWRATLASRPQDPRALLAVATFERSRFRYERSDSLLSVLEALPSATPPWRAMARTGRAAWRALGMDIVAADSLATSARTLGGGGATPDVEAEALLVLAQIRQRTQGPRVGRQLLGEWWSLIPAPTPLDSAQWSCSKGVLDDQLGDTTGYGRVRHGALIAERLASWRVAGNCRLGLAQIAERRGYVSSTPIEASFALSHFRRIDYAPGIALASQWYGYSRVVGHAYAEGKALLEEAVLAARRTRFESVEGWAYSGLAQLFLDLGDLGRARRYATLAATSHARRRDLWGVATSRRFEADAMQAAGDLSGALTRYVDAQDAYAAARIPQLAVGTLVARTKIQIRLGLLDSAERTIDIGTQLGRTTDAWRSSEEPQLRGLLALKRNRLEQADSLFRSSALAHEWRRGDWSLAATVLAMREAQVALRRDRMALADSILAGVLGAIEEWRRRPLNAGLTASLAQLSANWSGLTEIYPDVVAELVSRRRVETAFALVERLRARDVVERRLRTVALMTNTDEATRALQRNRGGVAVVTLAELRRALGAEEAMVTYVLGIDDAPTTAFVVTRDTARVFRLPGRSALVPDIQRFLQLASSGMDGVSASRRLGSALLDSVVAALPPQVTRLVISPDGDLHRIPFDALRLADGRYLLERAAVSVAPSATTLLALRATSPPTGDRVVAIGDPRYAAVSPGAMSSDAERAGFVGTSLQRLRHSGDEARRVASFGIRSTLLLGRDATEGATIRAANGDVGVLHVASHGLVDDGSQFNTALAVTPGDGGDGFLTAEEVSRLELKGPLVVLSACRSSGGVVLGGEGLRGLTAPLLEGGARAVVGTHWSIGDRSVVPFIERFYAAMASGDRPDDALRRAKLEAIRAGMSISDWGSFTITGDASMRVRLRDPGRRSIIPWIRDTMQPKRETRAARGRD